MFSSAHFDLLDSTATIQWEDFQMFTSVSVSEVHRIKSESRQVEKNAIKPGSTGPPEWPQRHQLSLELVWVDGDLQSTPTPFLNQPVSPGTGSTCAITAFALQIVVERQI